MRVARRVRPSRVGCGATVSRRRLHATSFSENDSPKVSLPTPRLTLVIDADGTIRSATGERIVDLAPEQGAYVVAPDLAGANSRG
jgi:hypothetical protein